VQVFINLAPTLKNTPYISARSRAFSEAACLTNEGYNTEYEGVADCADGHRRVPPQSLESGGVRQSDDQLRIRFKANIGARPADVDADRRCFYNQRYGNVRAARDFAKPGESSDVPDQ